MNSLSKQASDAGLNAQAPIAGLYEHYKGGLYQVLGVARSSENIHCYLVVYSMLHQKEVEGMFLPAGMLWVRPLDLFTEQVTNDQGQRVPRFKLLKTDK